MACIFLTVLPLVWCATASEVIGPTGGVEEVRVLAGSRVLLPCNITPSIESDAPILVLFYSGITGMPIYSIDARDGQLNPSVRWSELGDRAHFNLAPGHQGLVIDTIDVDDAGSYKCRVDFRSSPTRNLRVKLTVIVPPQRMTITDQSGQSMSGVIGPYPVGATLSLTCEVTGGAPRPRVVWWHENVKLDEVVEVKTVDATHNILSLPNLSRQHLFRGLTCKAYNSNLTQPLSATVTLDVTFAPLEVKITGADSPFASGESRWVQCETTGSRPPATLTWWLDGTQVTEATTQAVHDGNVSKSSLQLHPTQHHDGAVLSCRAENSLMEAAAIEDGQKLTVHYAPQLRLKSGLNLDLGNIKEGDDVYFECSIQANPPVYKVNWYLNGEEMQQNISVGIIQSNQSLVLQRVGRTCSGRYSCSAANIHGTATSNTLDLSVKFAPVCSAGQRWIYGGGREHPVNVTCSVDAHPEATHFLWAFNTSSEYVDIPETRVRKGKGHSMVAYTPQTHHDFGSLICWGVNEVGRQKVPCVYHIVPASVPEPVHNCSSWQNASSVGEVVVSCAAGWGGGLPQTFSLEVRTLASPNSIQKHRVLAVLRDQWKPYFTVTGLEPGKEYKLAVIASNAQGFSRPTFLIHMTPIDVAEKRTSAVATEGPGNEKEQDFSTLIAVIVGLVCTLVVILLALVLIVRKKRSRSRNTTSKPTTYEKNDPSYKLGEDVEYMEPKKEKKPDVILVKSGVQSKARDEEALVNEYTNPRTDESIEGNPRKSSSERPEETDRLLQQESTPSAVSIQGLQSPTGSVSSTNYHDSCATHQIFSSTSTYSTRRKDPLAKTSPPPSSSKVLGGYPPPHPSKTLLGSKGTSAPSSSFKSSSSGVTSSNGTRESRV